MCAAAVRSISPAKAKKKGNISPSWEGSAGLIPRPAAAATIIMFISVYSYRMNWRLGKYSRETRFSYYGRV